MFRGFCLINARVADRVCFKPVYFKPNVRCWHLANGSYEWMTSLAGLSAAAEAIGLSGGVSCSAA
jgi:hypothetical protein